MAEKGLIIVVSGPAGSGKSTVNKFIRENPDYVFSISRTTRYVRPGEIDGKDYYFISREEFEQKLKEDDFLENTDYCGNLYGTPKSLVYEQIEKGKNVILEIEVDGAMQVKAKRPDAVLIMLLPPSFAAQEARLRGRGTESEDKIVKRLQKTYGEIAAASNYDYIVFNHDGGAEDAANAIFGIVNSKHGTVSEEFDPESYAASRIPDLKKLYFGDKAVF